MREGRDPPPMTGPRVDVVQYPSGVVKAVPAGKGREIVESQRRSQPSSLLRDRVLLAAILVAILGAGFLAAVVMAYSVLISATLLLGLLLTLLVFAGAGILVAVVAGVRYAQRGDARLLDEGIPLEDAREQWNAEPVSAVTEEDEGGVEGDGVKEDGVSEDGAGKGVPEETEETAAEEEGVPEVETESSG